MENAIINHNVYKFSNHIVDMTTINGKDISKLSTKEIEKYLDELDTWLGIQKGLEDVKAGRVLNEKEAYAYLLKKCQEK